MNVKVKICGVQKSEDAEKVIAVGADYLGLIFVSSSKRAVDRKTAKIIVNNVKNKIKVVGVFRDNSLEEINSLCEELDFDLVQLHGNEKPDFCRRVSRPIIKSFGLSSEFIVKETLEIMKDYDVPYFLIDRLEPGIGESLPVAKAKEIAKSVPLFFAGGLTPENVGDVVKEVKPFAVDVISGVKTDNKFDFEKMKRFVVTTKGVKV